MVPFLMASAWALERWASMVTMLPFTRTASAGSPAASGASGAAAEPTEAGTAVTSTLVARLQEASVAPPTPMPANLRKSRRVNP